MMAMAHSGEGSCQAMMTIQAPKSTVSLGGGPSMMGPQHSHHHPSSSSRPSSTASLSSMAENDGRGGASSSVQGSVFTFPTPKKSNQRPGRRRHPSQIPPPPPNSIQTQHTRKSNSHRAKHTSIQREYQLLQSQTILLIGTASLGFVLFLLFTLPLAALVGLTVMVTSLGACLLVASAAVKARYRLELEEHPLGLLRYLPSKVQSHLTEKSLHDCLSPSGSMESLASLASQLNNNGSSVSLSSMSQYGSRGSLASLASRRDQPRGRQQQQQQGRQRQQRIKE